MALTLLKLREQIGKVSKAIKLRTENQDLNSKSESPKKKTTSAHGSSNKKERNPGRVLTQVDEVERLEKKLAKLHTVEKYFLKDARSHLNLHIREIQRMEQIVLSEFVRQKTDTNVQSKLMQLLHSDSQNVEVRHFQADQNNKFSVIGDQWHQ